MCLSVVEIHVQVARDSAGLLFPAEEDAVHLAPLDISWILQRSLINTQFSEMTQLTTNGVDSIRRQSGFGTPEYVCDSLPKCLCFSPESPSFRSVNAHP